MMVKTGILWTNFFLTNIYEQSCHLAETAQWLKDKIYTVIMGGMALPLVYSITFVILTVTETDRFKGDTAGGGGKPATLETGAVVRVPLFVSQVIS